MSTVNVAAKTLVSVASKVKLEHSEKWRPSDHLRFMVMLMTWVTVWVLRVLMDHFPFPMTLSPHYLLNSFSSIGSSFPLALPSSSTSTPAVDLIFQDDIDGPSVQALGRALTHVLALMNEIPATSRKYQFAMAMADKIMDGNFRDGHMELAEVNRTALSSAFARTLSLLYRAVQNPQASDDSSNWTSRVIRSLPLGSYIASYVNGMSYCLSAVIRTVGSGMWQLEKRRPRGGGFEEVDDVVAEKLAQELLWITNKLRDYGAVDEALLQWSYASGLASLALTVNNRVQGYIVKISAILIGDLTGDTVISSQVKFGLLALWLPLFCHANNGLAYPYLSSFEKIELERAMDEVISALPAMDQEVILTNWVQDFAVTASEWPNLQASYDRWCQSTRELAT
ncbi:unnamed protein product [Dovyalis caffra]|uniref:At3g05675-like ankyrin-like domain-containing protein n=1 Tax=Dovyalis caffra TaxID=77055 RepID=A0AAV1RRW2_9ROSI|nr:unnamed protein product [Dovyalis caffra]